MTTTINTGGPAFPIPGLQHDADFNGMTLRDYFAAKAMHAALVTPHTWRDLGYTPKSGLDDMQNSARMAYQLADAMLAARGEA